MHVEQLTLDDRVKAVLRDPKWTCGGKMKFTKLPEQSNITLWGSRQVELETEDGYRVLIPLEEFWYHAR
jgi:hypothetical protein